MFKSYFTFTKNQSRAIVTLVICIISCLILYFSMPYMFAKKNEIQNEELYRLMAQITIEDTHGDYAENYLQKYVARKLTPFHFDPNTLDSNGFKKLGLSEKLVHTILNYRNKGGKFYNEESLKRIYGLHEEEYKQLEPYIKISIGGGSSYFKSKEYETITIEVNSADTAQLIKLKGIGSRLSMNIVHYRTQLGGFVNKDQLKEVYGISDQTFGMISSSIKVNTSLVKKINLNEATFQEINAHPYLKGEIGKAIVDFRKKNNYHIDNIFQLKEIELLDDKLFRKIAPYINTQ